MILPVVFILLLFFLPKIVLFLKVCNLKKRVCGVCAKCGGQVTWCRTPYQILRSPRKDFDFKVQMGERKYHVLMISAPHRLREYSFLSPDELAVYRKISFHLIARGRGLRGMGILNSVDFGLNMRSFPISLEEKNAKNTEKILLFYPVSKDVTWFSPGKGEQYLRKVSPWEKY